MSNFINDIAKLIGYNWHENKMSSNQLYRRVHKGLENKALKNLDALEKKLTEIEPNSGLTYARIMYNKQSPTWFWIEENFPGDVLNRIKEKSGIK